ncbi:MAG: DUF2249 domain-containing protein [Saprospiraceae bacterium]|jgi:uncharacterized protein (DUF2249 family)|nr:DUF2249 domain-containing protein [Saprospiraceae bacterium]
MTINADTKIGTILKENPDALEAIVSISPRFDKLRNPLLRKIMAPRTTLAMASRVGGCSVADFFEKLQPLGFQIEQSNNSELPSTDENTPPGFLTSIRPGEMEILDVRPVIEGGKDPFTLITGKIKDLKPGQVLQLINSFEPAPLINILSKQGFEYYVEHVDHNLVYTYFYKNADAGLPDEQPVKSGQDWDAVLQQFENNLMVVDVRHLEMPQPMLTILEALDELPQDKALFVYHKRIPVFLLPELQDRQLEYRIKEISDSEVHLLIFKG